jgi:small subunit ribosomal protein S16
MQRMGRKGHPTYRVVVQDSRWAASSGRFIAQLGSYDPHTKTTTLVKEKAELYLNNGAQPSERVVKLFASEGVKMPKWVKEPSQQKREIRNPEKLRRNRPAEEKAEESAPEAEQASEAPAVDAETPEAQAPAPADKKPVEEAVDTEAPAAEEAKEEPAEESTKKA